MFQTDRSRADPVFGFKKSRTNQLMSPTHAQDPRSVSVLDRPIAITEASDSDSAGLIFQHIVRTLRPALTLQTGGSPVDIDRVADVVLTRKMIQPATAFFLEQN
jgi:hypothetical protein